MPRVDEVKCNICGESMRSGVIAMIDRDEPRCIAFVPIEHEDEATKTDLALEYLCGEACAHIRLSRALSATPTAQQLQEVH